MSNIENRIVSMTFDNENFEKNVASTIVALDELSHSVRLAGTAEGFTDLEQAANNVNLSTISDALDNISAKFSIMGTIGFAAIQKLTHGAMDLASNLTNKALGPLLGGGRLRAENLEQARFMFRGLGMDVEQAMDSATLAVTGTAYGLDAAAKVAAQLGGSGMQAGEQMTGALRGIAGVAAMTSTSYEEMGDVFTSAAGKGRISGYELQRIGQRGLNAAAALANVWGTTEQEVRRMASEGEISFEKFAAGMDEAFGEHATKANETYTGSLANMRAALARVGAGFFGPHMLQQRDLFNALSPLIDKVNKALGPLIETLIDIKGISIAGLIDQINSIDLTNFTKFIELISGGLRNAFTAFQQLLGPIKEAFREIFPPSSVSLLVTIGTLFERFTERLKMGEGTLQSIKSVFRGVFSAIAIGIEVVKVAAGIFGELFKAVVGALGFDGSGALKFFANLGESIANLKVSLVDNGGIRQAVENIGLGFQKMGEAISLAFSEPMEAIRKFRDGFLGIFSSDEGIPGSEGVTNAADRVNDRFGMLTRGAEKIGDVWRNLADRLSGIRKVLSGIWGWISNWFSELGEKLATVFRPSDFDAAVDAVNVGLLGGIAYLLRKFLTDGFSIDLTGGVLGQLSEIFERLTGVLSAMQIELRAKALVKIASAIAILTGSILVLSMIDSVALTKSLLAISVAMGQLMAAMAIMEKISLGTGAAKMGIIAGAMILLSVAVGILAISIRSLSKLSLGDLAKGLIGVAGAMAVLVTGIKYITTDEKSLIRAGVSMIIISTALNILARAVKSFGKLSLGELAKGLGGIAASLGILVGGLHLMPNDKKVIASSIAIGAIAVALNILYLAVKSFGGLDFETMGTGLLGIAGSLTILLISLNLMPNEGKLLASSVAMIAMGIALNIMAKAVETMGAIPLGELAKGMGAFIIMLGSLAVAMILMTTTSAGAAAMIIAAAALHILANVLEKLGQMKMQEIALGLAAMAGVFLVLGAAGTLLAPLVPVLLGLGAAMLLIGGSFALVGIGLGAFAKGLGALGKLGKKSVEGFIEVVKIMVRALPEILSEVALAFVGMFMDILDAAPLLVKGIKVLLAHILDTVIELAPKISEAMSVIITEFLRLVREKTPELIETGFVILMAFLKGIDDNIEEITNTVVNIITKFIDTLTERVPEIVDSVFNFLQAVLFGVVSKLASLVLILLPFGTDLIGGFLKGIVQKAVEVTSWFTKLPLEIVKWVGSVVTTLLQKGIDLLTGLLTGIGRKVGDVTNWFTSLPGKIVGWVGSVIGTLTQKGRDLITGLYDAVIDRYRAVKAWFNNIGTFVKNAVGSLLGSLEQAGKDLIRGLWNGIVSMKDWVINKAKDVGGWVINPVKKAFELFSPSRVFMGIGENVGEGLIIGLDQMRSGIESSSEGLGQGVTDGFRKTLTDLSDYISDVPTDFTPTITPVLDLSKIKAGSKDISGMINNSTMRPEVSFNQARRISHETSTKPREPEFNTPEAPREIKFEQNIYAPEALTVSDIYKNTKNQITLAKEELNV